MEPLLLTAALLLGIGAYRGRAEIRREWHAAKLRAEIRMGRKTWGRQPGDNQLSGGQIPVDVPVEATIEAALIRDGRRLNPYTLKPLADGERVVLSRRETQIAQADLDALMGRPHRWARRDE